MQNIDKRAGKLSPKRQLISPIDVVAAYFRDTPNPRLADQLVKFGTSGHRGSSLTKSFNEWHILAITQAICDFRKERGIDGPLFIGIDTHILSEPAAMTALEVLAGNGVEVMLSEGSLYTPTPVISHAILAHNRRRKKHLADGIVITPSHNPPGDGGFKYNPPHGGPAEPAITGAIEKSANVYLKSSLKGIKRMSYEKAVKASTTHYHCYIDRYVDDLCNVVDLKCIRDAGLHIAVDPLGGAGIDYWGRIQEKYGLDLTVVNGELDPTFSFVPCDWDGKIRMDPSSKYPMKRLIGLKKKYDVAFACDTDHDRHGVVTKSAGLLPPNHYLSACIDYLFSHRPLWPQKGAIGKTLVSSQMIDFTAEKWKRKVFEVPVGFKWFVEGLLNGSLLFVCEESAGASFARFDGKVWTTDKDGITAALLAAEMTARTGKDPGEIYAGLTKTFGVSYFERFEAVATKIEREKLLHIEPEQVQIKEMGKEKVTAILNRAPGNNELIGGVKVVAKSGWFAARPSGTEDIYRIYVESFKSRQTMEDILKQAQKTLAFIHHRGIA